MFKSTKDRVRRLAIVMLVLLLGLAIFGRFGTVWSETKSLTEFQPQSGRSYWVHLGRLVRPPWNIVFTVTTDTGDSPHASKLRVLQNGEPLAEPHAEHAAIAEAGGGRYSHWGNDLIFSSSDNSSPLTNGRGYAISFPVRLSSSAFAAVLAFVAITLFGFYLPGFRAKRHRARQRTTVVAASSPESSSSFGLQTAPAVPAAAAPRHWTKSVVLAAASIVLLAIFSIGLVVSADMIGRAMYSPQRTGLGIDVSVFHYRDFVVTTQPANVSLGHGKNYLDEYFGGSDCLTQDGTSARFNSLGFRSPEFVNLPPKAPNEIRIIMTGGSVSISWNVSEACTLDNELKRLLALRFPDKDIKIFNLGSAAWISLQELVAIERYAFDIKPDLIVAFDGFNDIEHSFTTAIGVPYAGWRMAEAFDRYNDWILGGPLTSFQGLRIIRDFRELLNSDLSFGLLPGAKAASRYPERAAAPSPGLMATRVELPIHPKRIAERTDFDPHNQNTVDDYLRNMRLMGLVAHSFGSRVLYALQPSLYLKDPMADFELRMLDVYEREINYVVQGYSRVSAGLEKLAAESQRDRFLDLSAPFQGDKTSYFLDYAHINAAGYRIVAARIAAVAAELLSPATTKDQN